MINVFMLAQPNRKMIQATLHCNWWVETLSMSYLDYLTTQIRCLTMLTYAGNFPFNTIRYPIDFDSVRCTLQILYSWYDCAYFEAFHSFLTPHVATCAQSQQDISRMSLILHTSGGRSIPTAAVAPASTGMIRPVIHLASGPDKNLTAAPISQPLPSVFSRLRLFRAALAWSVIPGPYIIGV